MRRLTTRAATPLLVVAMLAFARTLCAQQAPEAPQVITPRWSLELENGRFRAPSPQIVIMRDSLRVPLDRLAAQRASADGCTMPRQLTPAVPSVPIPNGANREAPGRRPMPVDTSSRCTSARRR